MEDLRTWLDQVDRELGQLVIIEGADWNQEIGAIAHLARQRVDGWVNMGTYRLQAHDRNTLGLYMAPTADGRKHMQAAFERGEPLPIAISIGHHPLLFMVASMATPKQGMSEYDYAGGLR